MESWARTFVSFIPFALLIAFWIYFVRKARPGRHQELVERSFVHMERVEALLERIAVQAERDDRK